MFNLLLKSQKFYDIINSKGKIMNKKLINKLTAMLVAGTMIGGVAGVATGCGGTSKRETLLLQKISYDTNTTLSKGIHSIELSASEENFQIIINTHNDLFEQTSTHYTTRTHKDYEILYSLEKENFYNLFNSITDYEITDIDKLSQVQFNLLYDTISNYFTLVSCECVLDEQTNTNEN